VITLIIRNFEVTAHPDPEVLMKRSSSLLLLFLLTITACSLTFAQAKRPQRIPAPPADFARFQSVVAYTDGQGVFMRWEMASELGNLGFLVYRVGQNGLEPVSDGVTTASTGTSTRTAKYDAK
jgi:hypothetical protein